MSAEYEEEFELGSAKSNSESYWRLKIGGMQIAKLLTPVVCGVHIACCPIVRGCEFGRM